jgi:hypothetical protein
MWGGLALCGCFAPGCGPPLRAAETASLGEGTVPAAFALRRKAECGDTIPADLLVLSFRERSPRLLPGDAAAAREVENDKNWTGDPKLLRSFRPLRLEHRCCVSCRADHWQLDANQMSSGGDAKSHWTAERGEQLKRQ